MPRGSPRKPTNVHIIGGTWRRDRHGGAGKAKPPGQRLKAQNSPGYLRRDARAARIWREALRTLPWLQRTDKYCFALWVSLQAEFEENPTGMMAARMSILRLLAGDLGLTAAGRARLGFTAASPTGPSKDKYFDD